MENTDLEKPRDLQAIVIEDDLKWMENPIDDLGRRIIAKFKISRENWEYQEKDKSGKPSNYISGYSPFEGYHSKGSKGIAGLKAVKMPSNGGYGIYLISNDNFGLNTLIDLINTNEKKAREILLKQTLSVAREVKGDEYLIHEYDKSAIEKSNYFNSKFKYNLKFEDFKKIY